MEILIGADLVPTKSNEDVFCKKNFIGYLGEDFKNIWLKADYRMFNLETPLGNLDYKPIDKNGPNLLANSETINGIKSLNPDLVFLANNHILDYGEDALANTIKLLENNKIDYTGIVDNINKRLIPKIIEKDGIKIGIYNVCETEFSAPTEKNCGANIIKEVESYKIVNELKKACNFVFVIYHAGKECYRYPSPDLKRICENFVDFGADVVITQHSHCIGCKQIYKDKTIIYGQGNFIFDDCDDEYWNTAILIDIFIEKGKLNIKYIPIEKSNNLIKISSNSEILENFNTRSKEIEDNSFIENKYSEFANKNINSYLHMASGIRMYNRILNRLSKRKYFEKKYNKKDCLALLNIIECEAHRELFIRGLKEKIKEYQNGDKSE